MPALVEPSNEVHLSYADAVEEFRPEGRHTRLDADVLRDPAGFARHLADLVSGEDPVVAAGRGLVAMTTLWWVEDDRFVGEVRIRHGLTETLRRVGGHIGYAVRPSARRRGHATAMLRAALPRVGVLGIDPALVTCDVTNVWSRRVIEGNGGRLFDQDESVLRFWVPTSAAVVVAGDSSGRRD